MDKLVEIKKNQLTLNDEYLKKLHEFDIIREEMEVLEKRFKQQLIENMKELNIKTFKNETVAITYIAPTTRKKLEQVRIKFND